MFVLSSESKNWRKILWGVYAVFIFGATSTAFAQKPYILDLTGSCSPGSLSIEYLITGAFGGYSGFVKTENRFALYEIPTVRDGLPAKSLKIIVRGAKCRTQIFNIPEVEKGGRVIRVRPRRSRQIEFQGVIRFPEQLQTKNARLTVEYWAHWKCTFFGIPDCLIGPTRIDAVDVKKDGRFKVYLPDLATDGTLMAFSERGTFQLFVRDRETGNVLYNLVRVDGTRDLPVSASYPRENGFTALSY